MIVYLNANINIYLVENHPVWGSTALARIAQSGAMGDQIAIGDASRLECLVDPYMLRYQQFLSYYIPFSHPPDVKVLPLTSAVCERAACIRATSRLKPLDSLHLATAIEHGCGLFLTNDAQLQRCIQINVEVLA